MTVNKYVYLPPCFLADILLFDGLVLMATDAKAFKMIFRKISVVWIIKLSCLDLHGQN